ncbi:hypothetical protein [Oceanobacillus saliphilus]|uniref:alpha/beta hydrolase n=1 Tax=Oceanobacillus saliphilus TaxID=2925834 RepID=UPI00201D9C5A|nr:hypothetical protein [Oceanobacillus saliphilus]
MNALEVGLVILIGITILVWHTNKYHVLRLLLFTQWIVLFFQMILFDWRWPMIPFYLFTIYQSIKLLMKKGTYSFKYKLLSLFFLLLFFLLPSFLFPWNTLSMPTGAYKVGTQSFEVVDTSRDERWSNDEEHRRLMVQVWYPTDETANRRKARYHDHPDLFMKEFTELNGIPGFLLQSFVKQKIPAYAKAPLLNRNQPFPVVFFSHGFGSNRSQNHFQVLELASHGYIVIGIDHTYYSPGTLFPDSTNPGVINIEFSENTEVMDEYLYEWSNDAQSVLNWVERLNNGGLQDLECLEQFVGQIDLNKVAYIGHSFGGASASHTLAVDQRFQVGINMDGFPYGRAAELGIEQPFLTIISDTDLLVDESDGDYLAEYYRRITDISGADNIISIKGTSHLDFSDFPLLSPITSWLGMTGKIPPWKIHRMINQITLEFLNDHLK